MTGLACVHSAQTVPNQTKFRPTVHNLRLYSSLTNDPTVIIFGHRTMDCELKSLINLWENTGTGRGSMSHGLTTHDISKFLKKNLWKT